jgi:dTDP-4-dehydrorhamnose 3,5-epimerase
MKKVCVFGASGFVGRALVERLKGNNYDVISAIHTPGNAWSILRYDTPIVLADLLNEGSIDNALKDCDYVVNLTLGKFDEMVQQLDNLITSCKRNNVKKLIHISSITVYGDFPHPSSKYETGPTLAKRRSYGWYKMKQDKLIRKANGSGLSAVSLCPPHITGAYSRLFHQVVDSIKNETFALVEDGRLPCNIVDVNNVCQAIELCFKANEFDGDRIFITNGDKYTWRDLAEQAASIAGKRIEDIPTVSKDELLKMNDKVSLIGLIKKALINEDIKKEIGKTVIVKNKTLNRLAKGIYLRFNDNKLHLQPQQVSPKINYSLCKQQLRGIRHEIIRANKILNYVPIVDSKESFEIFKSYYTTLYGYNTEYWNLVSR